MFGPNHQDVTTFVDDIEWAIAVTTRFGNGESVNEDDWRKANDILGQVAEWETHKQQVQLKTAITLAERHSAN